MMITRELADHLIHASRAKKRPFAGQALVAAGVLLLIATLFIKPQDDSDVMSMLWLLPHVALVGLLVWAMRFGQQQREQSQRMLSGFEAVQLREWDRAAQSLNDLLSRPIRHARARVAALLSLAVVAEADDGYDVSQHIYEAILSENTGDPLQQHTARVGLAAAMLRNGQITDGIRLIEKLERAELTGPLKAQIELLSLFREVTMGQAAGGIERADQRRDLFRAHLGTRAGYGYGLLAMAFDRAEQPDNARKEWYNATLLLGAKELIARFRELEPIARKYAAAENPV